jgi:hypothetical protein
MNMKTNQILANDYTTVFESPAPKDIFIYSPGVACCPNGRLIATCDLGGAGVERLDGVKAHRGADVSVNQGKVFVSDDAGGSWHHVVDFPLLHARPFVADSSLYIIGHAGDLGIMRSDDWGDTWSDVTWVTENQLWHQAPCNVWYANGRIYLVMERYVKGGWSNLAPVVMAGNTSDNLLDKDSWFFSNELTFADAVDDLNFKYLGVPFFTPGPQTLDNPNDHRDMAPAGWLESNIVQFTNPDHVWFDPKGKTFHLWMRAHTGSTNLACIAKVVESSDGTMEVMLEKSPAGVEMLFVPCPGGHMKFHILYDEETSLFWLLSSQSVDSMTRPDRLPPDRFNLPNNERQRLALHFSKNCVDWCFAGLVATGDTSHQSRHYASMVIRGDDLYVLSRSGDHRAVSAHNGNLMTCHKVCNFRKLVY